MSSTIAIIGGNGFIGKNFSQYFSEKGYKVMVIDYNLATISNTDLNISFHEIEVRHTQELVTAIKNCDHVIWLVHASIPSTKDDSLADDFGINVFPIIKFLEKAKENPLLKKFIYLSSGGTVYGNSDKHVPIKENHAQTPISGYGLSKVIAEKYIEYLTKACNFESVILRPSNVFGENQNLVRPQGIIGYAFKAIKENHSLDLYNEGLVVRDFIYVRDVAIAVEKIILGKHEKGKVTCYNLGSNKGYSIKQILEKIEDITGKKLSLNHKSSRDFDCDYNVLDTSKISEELGWKIETELQQGLEKVWDWIRLGSIN
jgi:UDP-glucose 4-epimerase